MQQRSAIPGAATARVRDLLAGPARTGRVLHSGPDAVYADLAGRVVGVLSARAVHVPCGIRTTLPTLPPVPLSAAAAVGDGVLVVGPLRVHVGRLVDATAPRTHPATPGFEALASTGTSTGATDVRAELPEAALAALRAGDPAAVGLLLGRGSGLTPLGDDVLCGWLATTRLLDDAARTAVAAEALRLAPERTTRLSAELVACAVDGEVIPQFRRLLLALSTGTGVGDAVAVLRTVGHTSGAGLTLGALLALQGAAGHREAA